MTHRVYDKIDTFNAQDNKILTLSLSQLDNQDRFVLIEHNGEVLTLNIDRSGIAPKLVIVYPKSFDVVRNRIGKLDDYMEFDAENRQIYYDQNVKMPAEYND